MAEKYGYARVSSREQNLARQLEQLKESVIPDSFLCGAERIGKHTAQTTTGNGSYARYQWQENLFENWQTNRTSQHPISRIAEHIL